MPSINRKQIRQERTDYKHDDKSAVYYNSSAWHSLRNEYYVKHPLCECCMSHDRVTVADHVHHKRAFLNGITDSERWQLLLDENNLMSVCTACHSALHAKAKHYGLAFVDELTDFEFANR
jgi:hypothetical protein